MITKEKIETLYKAHEAAGYDNWNIVAEIINELVTRDEFPNDPEYFFHVKEVWNMSQEYINSTYCV